jgi:hypothetical protein
MPPITNCITGIAVGSEELHVFEPYDGATEAAVSKENWGLRLVARAGCGGECGEELEGSGGDRDKGSCYSGRQRDWSGRIGHGGRPLESEGPERHLNVL